MATLLPVLLLVALPSADPASATKVVFPAEQVVFYEKEVKPLLQKHCIKCHGADEKKLRGGLNLTRRADVLAGGDTGPAVDLEKPETSLLIQAITNQREGGADVMPPTGKLSDPEIAILKKWVIAKLPVTTSDLGQASEVVQEPHSGGITEEAKKYWAYQPIKRPTVPSVKVANPIDAFLLARLNAKGLKANPPADRVALVRRVYYDLIGLPPTPEQVDAFVNDKSSNAYARLVDELLASPHYGEKWGRHWLDVVRYAETNGYERDGPKPNAWKYRDYVIRSFNADKPFDQFIREQLAGDEMPWSAEAITATGFYRLGIWDDEPADREMALFDGYDDYVSVTGQVFLGMTLNCARCHEHKKDPILHADYYRFLAFFRDIRPFSDTRGVMSTANSTDITATEKRKLYEAELNARNAEITKLTEKMTKLEDEVIKRMPEEDQRASEGIDRPRVVAKLPAFLKEPEKREYNRLRRERDQLKNKPSPHQEFALSVNQCEVNPPPTHVLARGNPYAKKEEVKPGFPTVLGFPDPQIPPAAKGAQTSGRRTILANWIASKDNPLTARVMMNRVWQHHFGKGIVATPNDFGKLGELPTHPELLDWLASEFMAGGWKLKPIHRLMLLSESYQRSSTTSTANMQVDPGNTLYWRFTPRRLTAEEVRDSMLMASGQLNLTQFGESVFPKIPREVLAGQSRPGEGWRYDPARPDAGNRRSVYVFIKRSLQVPILIAHDQADTDSSCPVRYTTTVPTQALGMLNGEFAHEQALALAKRLHATSKDLREQVAKAIRLTTGRIPGTEEISQDVEFIQKMQKQFQLDATTALARYALLALNTNEFIYLD